MTAPDPPAARTARPHVGHVGWIVLAVVGAVALLNLRSGLWLNHVAGAWIEQAESFRRGTFYLPLDGAREVGGTRYFPLPIVVQGTLDKLFGDPVVAGKVVSLALAAGIVVLGARVLQRRNVPTAMVPLLLVAPFLTTPGVETVLGIRHDTIPTVAFVAILLAWRDDLDTRRAVAIGALVGVALLAKSSAVWIGLAVALQLVLVARRRLVAAVGGALLVAGGGLVLAQVASGGRLVDNVLLSGGDVTLGSLVGAPRGFADNLSRSGGVGIALVILAGVEIVRAARAREIGLLHLGTIANVCVVTLLFADPGVDNNHLVDLFVLSALLTGSLLSAVVEADGARSVGARALRGAVLGVVLLGVPATLYPDAKETARSVRDGDVVPSWKDDDPLADLVGPNRVVLSDDPVVARRARQVPRVADAFILRRVADDEPQVEARLVEDASAARFDVVVLISPLEDLSDLGQLNFGRQIRDALRARYVLAEVRLPYYVYVRR